MQTKQAKSHSPGSLATRAAEPSQKAAHSAGALTRLPAWTRVMGDHPPISLQTKLIINQPGDAYEQEADRVADQVMRMPDSVALVQRECAYGGTCGSTGEC